MSNTDTSTSTSTFVLPSSPADRKKIKQMVEEGVNCETRIAAERDQKKAIVDRMMEEFEIPKKIANKMIRTMYKHNYSQQQAEMDDFQIAYETIANA